MSNRNGSGSGVFWFLAGLGVGAAVAILYAPQSGDATREILMAKAEEGRDFVKKRAKEAKEQAGQWADRGKEVYASQKDQIRSAVEAGRQAYREKVSAVEGDGENL
ncbi:MAG TPA: YtxH domain-containing protein [Terriglobales bacterium]|jgi:gas vesicle protein